ncbi:hypothetical protein BGX24_000487 [Mortierella sp. AD032]|nr:hypothetical protein BGX24_000487 [Mortierella sp. AD032]
MWDPQPNTLRLGVLMPFNAINRVLEDSTVRKTLTAIRMAVDDINRLGIIPGGNVTLVLRDSQNPDLFTASGGAAAISAAGSLISAKVSGVIGDISSELTRYEALMTSSVKIPHCSFASINTILSDDAMYAWFFRTIPTTIVILDAALKTIVELGWRRVTLIYDVDIIGWAGQEYFAGSARKLGIYVAGYQTIRMTGQPEDPTFQFIKDTIDKTQSRIQLLISVGRMQTRILREMRKGGYLGPDYAWVTLNDISDTLHAEPKFSDYDGLIMIDNIYDLIGEPSYDKFLKQWMALDIQDYPGSGDPVLDHNEAFAYSCAMMIATVYGDLIRTTIGEHATLSDPFLREVLDGDHTDDVHVATFYRNKPYVGPSGKILLDEMGDRKHGDYLALSLQNGTSVPFALIFGSNYTTLIPAPFKSNQNHLPSDSPPWARTMCILAILLTLATSAMVFYFRDHIVIKAARSLTFKNYRIYRIFNSITVTNRIFHTGRLLKFLAVAVILTAIPPLVEVLVHPPAPYTINANREQWVRCHDPRVNPWRFLAAAVVPIFLVIFGVFLAFKTRNVMFLWNEAREISLVIYNIFFFGLLIVIFQFFDEGLYIATFYMTVIGTYLTATLALLCLFLPKFGKLLKAYKERDADDTTHSWHGKGPSRERQPRPGSSGFFLADGNGAGGGVSSTGRLGGIGGGGGVGGLCPSLCDSLSSATTLGRMPGHLNFLSFQTSSAFTDNHSPEPRPPMGTIGEADDVTVIPSVIDLSDPTANTGLAAPSDMKPELPRATTTSQKQGTQTTRSRRKSEVLSVLSSGDLESYNSNPIDLWMNSQLPRKRTGVGPLSSKRSSASSIKSSTLPQPQFVQGDFSDDISRVGGGGGRGGNTSRGRQLEEGGMAGQHSTQLNFQPGLDTNSSPGSQVLYPGIERCMDSFVFLVPIRVKRGWIASVLSHWSMATLILIPEAHAFLSLDSADKVSTSYLMTSMAQDHNTPDPTIRVTTCHNGTLFIRFETQSRLDAWMTLFDEQDLVALRPRSMSGSMLPTIALTSSFDQLPPQTYQSPPSSSTWRRESSIGSSTMLLNDPTAAGAGSGHGQDPDLGIGQPSSSQLDLKNRRASFGNLFSSASTLVGGVEGVKATRPIFGEIGTELSDLKLLPKATTAAGGGGGGEEANSQVRPWLILASTAYPSHPPHSGGSSNHGVGQHHPRGYQNPSAFDGGGHECDLTRVHLHIAPGEKSYLHHNDNNGNNSNANEIGNTFAATGGNAPMADPRASRQHNNNSSATDNIQLLRTIPSMPSSIHPTTFTGDFQSQYSRQPQPQPQPQQQSQPSTLYNTFSSSAALTDDDDDEDLYDPEFGIGGNGRRRFRHRTSTTSSARSSIVANNNNAFQQQPPRSLGGFGTRTHQQQQQNYHTAAMIPPAAVISTAAAACAAGWNESDALAAATADPSGSFLAGNTPQPSAQSNPSPSSRDSATTRESPDRKSFSEFRQSNNSLSTGLSLLVAGGRRSLGQIISDHSSGGGRNSKNKNFSPSAQRSPEVVPDKPMSGDGVAGGDNKVLSYSQYLAQNQAAAAAAEAARQSQPLPLPHPVSVAEPTTSVPIAPPTSPPVTFQKIASDSAPVPPQAQVIVTVASPLSGREEIMPPR